MADKIINEALKTRKMPDLWPVILAEFRKRLLSDEYAYALFNCARILQAEHYDLFESLNPQLSPRSKTKSPS